MDLPHLEERMVIKQEAPDVPSSSAKGTDLGCVSIKTEPEDDFHGDIEYTVNGYGTSDVKQEPLNQMSDIIENARVKSEVKDEASLDDSSYINIEKRDVDDNEDIHPVLLVRNNSITKSKDTIVKVFSCSECEKIFPFKSYLEKHKKTCTGERPSKCRRPRSSKCICPRSHPEAAVREAYSISAEPATTDKGPTPINKTPNRVVYRCVLCPKAFISPETLTQHEERHMKEKQNQKNGIKGDVDIQSNVDTYKCSSCSKVFISAETLAKHEQKHIYACNFCEEVFDQKSALWGHIRIHSGKNPYSCKFCAESFAGRSTLIEHQSTHTGEKPYKCNICAKTFTSIFCLSTHRRIHTVNKLACSFCAKTFGHLGTLKEHERTHTGEKPFTCSICSKSFAQRGTYHKHKKTHK